MIFLPHTPKGTTYGSSLPKSAHYLQEWNISGKTGTHIDGITRHGYVTEDIFCMVELGSSGFTVVRYGIENFDFIIMAPNPNLANWGLLVYCYCRLFWIYRLKKQKVSYFFMNFNFFEIRKTYLFMVNDRMDKQASIFFYFNGAGTYGRFVLRFYSFEFQFWIFQECTNYRILVPIQLRFILFVLLKLAFSIFN